MGAGGAQTHIFELARGLIARGHKVILLSSGGETARALAALGAKCFCVKVDTARPLSVVGGILSLHALIRRYRPDVLHAHTRPMGLLCRLLGRVISDMPTYVSTVHARFSTDSTLHRLPWYSGASIAVSEDLKQYLLCISRGSLLPERVEVIPNGIDTERFCPRKREADGAIRLCFMSRLDADCSDTARLLCKIAPRLCEKLPAVQIYIIGGGSELDSISDLADKSNRRIGKRSVRVLGNIDAPELIISRCDGFIGVSRAALEAMSCALPTILSGNEGFGGLIRSENDLSRAKNSNFCCRGQSAPDERSLEKDILELCRATRRERAQLGALMRRFVLENNSSDKMITDTEAFYAKEIGGKSTRGQDYLICGYYGFGNIGDDALLSQAIERAGKQNAVALTRDPKRSARKFGVRCADRSNPFAVYCAIKRCKTLVFGGGSLLQSRTSFRSLCWYAALILYARSQGKRVELWANGIGDFSGILSEKLASRALRATDRIGVRDEASAKLIRALVPECASRLVVENDLALSCPVANDGRLSYILSLLGISEGEHFAVVAPKGCEKIKLLFSRKRKKAMSDYAAMRASLQSIVRLKMIPIFIPMYPAQDTEICRRLQRAYGGKVAHNIGISDLAALIASAKKVVSMRYHPLILSKKLGTESIKIGDDPKILAL